MRPGRGHAQRGSVTRARPDTSGTRRVLPTPPLRDVSSAKMYVNDVYKSYILHIKRGKVERTEKAGKKRERNFLLVRDALPRLAQHARAQEDGRGGEENIPPSYVHHASVVAT